MGLEDSAAKVFFAGLPKTINLIVVLIVVAIPEGLPLTVGISLAFSVMRMYKSDKILVKKLGVKDESQIVQADENSESGNKFAGKIYDYLLIAFTPTEEIHNDICDCWYDKSLNVTRIEDMGFIAFQYAANSNF